MNSEANIQRPYQVVQLVCHCSTKNNKNSFLIDTKDRFGKTHISESLRECAINFEGIID